MKLIFASALFSLMLFTSLTSAIIIFPDSSRDNGHFPWQLGWNLFSAPLNEASVSFSGPHCDWSPVWHWNGVQYVAVEPRVWTSPGEGNRGLVTPLDPGKAYWVKISLSSGAPDQYACNPNGNPIGNSIFSEFVNYPLHSGWNMVGGPNFYNAVEFADVKFNCVVRSGPWAFNTARNQYEKSSLLEPGKGYWIKVADSCTLHSGPRILN